MPSKKSIIIISSVLAAVLAALVAVLLILKGMKVLPTDSALNNSSHSSSINEQNQSVFEEIETEELESTETESKDEKKEIELQISHPSSKSVYTTDSSYTFSGTCDPKKPLIVNNKSVKVDKDGIFSLTYDLTEGKNTFTFKHKNTTTTYIINYNFVIIKSYSPKSSQSYSSGSTVTVSAVARNQSKVTATLNGTTITLSAHKAQSEEKENSETFITYAGSFKLPSKNTSDINLGKIKFNASYQGKGESFYSGTITCKKAKIKVNYNSNAAVLGANYINVGTGKITEIVAYEAETFDAKSTNDWSRPTNNYLPKGTVDYSAEGYYYYETGSTKKEYALLRCGRQVYTSKQDSITKKDIPVVKEYSGTLPDHNEINIASFGINGSHTVLTLDTLWKAPFYFDILPQKYANPSKQDYSISDVTSQYIDITLCYTTVFKGKITIPKTNPLFKSYKIIKGKSDYTIRLYLREQGGFYGWDANYNAKGQLVFTFLNPARVKKANNSYGVNLKGVKVLLDVGHGGKDPGALGFDGKNHSEAIQNLYLAKKIAAELKSIGATVYMTRTSDTTISNHNKVYMLKTLKPDICIAIHHNSAYSSSANGFDSYYSQPFSMKAASLIKKYTQKTGIYKKNELGWHYYFMARSSYCPVVLTENGYISNTYDYKNIISSDKNTKKAKAIVQGIADYFSLISPDDVPLEENNSSNSSSNNSSSSNSSSSASGNSSKPTNSSTSSSSTKPSSSSVSGSSSKPGSSTASGSSTKPSTSSESNTSSKPSSSSKPITSSVPDISSEPIDSSESNTSSNPSSSSETDSSSIPENTSSDNDSQNNSSNTTIS